MYNVESRYKDPDKFIQRLKSSLSRVNEWRDGCRDRWLAERGKQIVNWSGHTSFQSCSDAGLGILKVGDRIRIDGVVTKVVKGPETQSSIEYTVKKTLRTKEATGE